MVVVGEQQLSRQSEDAAASAVVAAAAVLAFGQHWVGSEADIVVSIDEPAIARRTVGGRGAAVCVSGRRSLILALGRRDRQGGPGCREGAVGSGLARVVRGDGQAGGWAAVVDGSEGMWDCGIVGEVSMVARGTCSALLHFHERDCLPDCTGQQAGRHASKQASNGSRSGRRV